MALAVVGAIDEFAAEYSISKAFIGLILLPIVGNAAEHVTSITMAAKGKMELTLGVAVGSSIQIAIGVIPVLVVTGWIINQPLSVGHLSFSFSRASLADPILCVTVQLAFGALETIILFVSVLLSASIIQDGKGNYLEGLMLVALYLVIALAFWVS